MKLIEPVNGRGPEVVRDELVMQLCQVAKSQWGIEDPAVLKRILGTLNGPQPAIPLRFNSLHALCVAATLSDPAHAEKLGYEEGESYLPTPVRGIFESTVEGETRRYQLEEDRDQHLLVIGRKTASKERDGKAAPYWTYHLVVPESVRVDEQDNPVEEAVPTCLVINVDNGFDGTDRAFEWASIYQVRERAQGGGRGRVIGNRTDTLKGIGNLLQDLTTAAVLEGFPLQEGRINRSTPQEQAQRMMERAYNTGGGQSAPEGLTPPPLRANGRQPVGAGIESPDPFSAD